MREHRRKEREKERQKRGKREQEKESEKRKEREKERETGRRVNQNERRKKSRKFLTAVSNLVCSPHAVLRDDWVEVDVVAAAAAAAVEERVAVVVPRLLEGGRSSLEVVRSAGGSQRVWARKAKEKKKSCVTWGKYKGLKRGTLLSRGNRGKNTATQPLINISPGLSVHLGVDVCG